MSAYDVLCLSHRPLGAERLRRLLARCASDRRVFVVEPPRREGDRFRLAVQRDLDGVVVATPHIPRRSEPELAATVLRHLLDELIADHRIERPVLWYRDPRVLAFSCHVRARAIVYDRGTGPAPHVDEELMLAHADLVLIDAHAVPRELRGLHLDVHAFPSCDGLDRFAGVAAAPCASPRPRIGYAGRGDAIDRELLAVLADRRPDLSFVVATDLEDSARPERANIHWLGALSDAELPAHLAAWDVAVLPLSRLRTSDGAAGLAVAALAAGLPIASTSVPEIVRPFGVEGLAWIGDGADAFAAAIDNAIAEDADRRRARATAYLDGLADGPTWAAIWGVIEAAVERRARRVGREITGPVAQVA
jgi:UDP-galactopyranose mutase